MLLGEVAPAAPALAGLVEIGLLLLAFGLVFVVRKFLEALFGWVADLASWIPGAGGAVEGWIRSAEQAVSHALGVAEHAIDAAIGASWHLLARYVEWLWREVRGNAVLALEIATGFYPIVVAIQAAKALLRYLHLTSTVTAAQVKTLEQEYKGIDKQLRTLEKEYNGIDKVLSGHRLRHIEDRLGTIEAQTIPAIQSADDQAASAINNLYDWAKGKAALLGIGTFATAVTAVLSAVGLDWLACRSRSGVNGKSGCALWNDIEGLLGAAIVTGLALDLPKLIGEAQTATPGIIGEIEKLAGLRK